jgi:hypothetical protein
MPSQVEENVKAIRMVHLLNLYLGTDQIQCSTLGIARVTAKRHRFSFYKIKTLALFHESFVDSFHYVEIGYYKTLPFQICIHKAISYRR